ncbi:MAG: eukaryotic-like serine/threonine-protein kinase [Microbacteriaceae bacterium]|nr:eukaryotic-like serine/threonine-protein kinase [Microbacteriaceae bacterium]
MSTEGGPLLGGRYRLGRALGSGGMGTVYRARDERLDRDVAVKLLRVSDDDRQQERFQREARFLAGIQHPNLVTAFDTGVDRGQRGSVVWLVMELVPGPDLGALLQRRGPLTSEDARVVVRDVAAALAALHAAGVIHRDLKPANLLLTAEPGHAPWRAKVADLGIAHILEAEHLTTTGQVLGTAPYLSPEQVSGDLVGTGSDVYSLGLLALEALTGERAFPGSAAESATARLVRPPAIPAWIDGGWRMLVESMTAVDPRNRPTAAQVEWATTAPLPELVRAAAPPTETIPWSDESTAAAAATVPLPVVGPPNGVSGAAREPAPRRRVLAVAAVGLAATVLAGTALAVSGASRDSASPLRSTVSSAPIATSAPVTTASPLPTPVATTTPAPRKTATSTSKSSRSTATTWTGRTKGGKWKGRGGKKGRG